MTDVKILKEEEEVKLYAARYKNRRTLHIFLCITALNLNIRFKFITFYVSYVQQNEILSCKDATACAASKLHLRQNKHGEENYISVSSHCAQEDGWCELN